ncbi:MAG: hypothetical protein HYT82_01360 [Candidatus Harrisonbacteria bacterium]|nr:hypothetical protein [Candidatus Harrisonbacteria bacterium]MBI2406523.1 hypothetical protein [Candidatus Harrisonbacteria bacterium]
MPQPQRIAFLIALLLLALGYLYAYVPARYVADNTPPFGDAYAILSDAELTDDTGDYTASALDAFLTDEVRYESCAWEDECVMGETSFTLLREW